jgi:2-polyprenyl-3-methyl-5-hydroxy-6-metoxy-1,4-benzoquinol methylase
LKRRWEVNGYTIVDCAGCSLVFVQNLPTPEQLGSHYAGAVGDAVYSDDNVECLQYYYQKLRGLIELRFPQRGKLLDVGCSGGWFLDAMKGWECHGNEIIGADAEFARQRHGDKIVTGRFEDYPLREGYFDVITLQDVFDHFPNPVSVLAKCNRMLRPGGGIVIKVHNISCLYAKLSGKTFYAVVPPSHLFYYDETTLSRILTKTGFQMVDSRFIAHLLKIRTVFLRLSRGDRESVFYRAFQGLAGSALGNIKLRKNLHDIITVFAVKCGTQP